MAMTTREERMERRFIDEEKAKITPAEQQELKTFMEHLREYHPDVAYVIDNDVTQDSREHHAEESTEALLQGAETPTH